MNELAIVLLKTYFVCMTTTLSSKGQIVLPKAVRAAHRWVAGTKFVLEEASGGILLRPIGREPDTNVTLDDVIGCVGYTGPARTVAEMEVGILRETKRAWSGFARRKRTK